MSALKLLSVLLEYPSDELWRHGDELLAAAATSAVPSSRRKPLVAFIEELMRLDPMVAQERWLALFDRGRAMSLLLFEHIHGESRDRGQAMVDLMQTYQQNGYQVSSAELPDYLPLLLEYLSQRPAEEVADWLQHSAHILELLAARAGKRGSPYALLFEILVEFGRGRVDLTIMHKRVADEVRDDTPEMMDRVWEEEAVLFGNEAPDQDCAPPGRLPDGVRRNEPKVMR